MSILVIGGTGTLGRQIVKRAIDEGYQVKCLVRNLRRSSFLKDWGAEIVYGDITIPETIPAAFKGVQIVIDASTLRPTDNYNAEEVDWKGKKALLEVAKLASVKRFIFFSFFSIENKTAIPLLDLKLKFIKLLNESSISCTVFQCAGFFQGLINQYAIPILDKQTIWLFKDALKTPFIDTQDAAKIVVSTLKEKQEKNEQYYLVGSKAWSPEEIINFCEKLSGEKAKISYIPGVVLLVVKNIFRSLEFTWNIADRLQFSEIFNEGKVAKNSEYKEYKTLHTSDLLSLEQYLKEYFVKIFKKLKEINYG
jgi:uncharacterized protein YbjT (DUF2867 family)